MDMFEAQTRFHRERIEDDLGREAFAELPDKGKLKDALKAIVSQVFPKSVAYAHAEDRAQSRRVTGLPVVLTRDEYADVPKDSRLPYLRAKLEALVASIPPDTPEYARLLDGSAWLSVDGPSYSSKQVEWHVWYRARYRFAPVTVKFETP